MDGLLRQGIHAIKRAPWMLQTQDILELHTLVVLELHERKFNINWIAPRTYYDDGRPLLSFVKEHLSFIIFRQKTPTQLVGWGMNGAGFEHIVLQPLMRLLHNCQHSSFCSKSFLWKGIDPN